MKKNTVPWAIEELRKQFRRIDFPEYQREPNIWPRIEKQRLIDSIVRKFDIASMYFYVDDDGSMDCIDGRQRISAIMSFLDENPDDEDNGFEFKVLNEIYDDDKERFVDLQGQTYVQIVAISKGKSKDQSKDKRKLACEFLKEFFDYELTIVKLSESLRPEEFNLQFTRLNLGTIINSGEKLHAMVGELRDECFSKSGLGHHSFLAMIHIPTRRYAKEQVAAQIIAQVFSFEKSGEYTRTRHFDLQRLFKDHGKLGADQRRQIAKTKAILDLLGKGFGGTNALRNRAITVSTVLLALKLKISTEESAKKFAEFIQCFVGRLQWQVGKGLDVDAEYRYLIDFQRHVTQASVEKLAVDARAKVLESQYIQWADGGKIEGDLKYKKRTGSLPVMAV